MAKIADEYLKIDPWKIIEEGWDSERNMVSESLFSLGNEYMGVRGYFEEGTKASSLRGSYFNGIYEFEKTEGTSYKGIVQKTHFMVNAVDWLYTKIFVDGELLSIGSDICVVSRLTNFVRELDMSTGILKRSFNWKTLTGKDMYFEFVRFLDMENSERGYQQITVESLFCSAVVKIQIGCDFSMIHAGRKKNYWNEIKKESFKNGCAILAETKTTQQKIFSGFTWNSNLSAQAEEINKNSFVGVSLTINLSANTPAILDKAVYNLADKKNTYSENDIWTCGIESLQKNIGNIEVAKKAQKHYWQGVWETGDISIDGDEKNQQGIRFCIFQMQQTYHGLDKSNNIGAKGLTGEAYNGHAFWDTETYCLPFFLYTNIKAAKNLLEYRYETLDFAKERAKMLDCTGACYPVATLNGEEACNLWQHASLQFQPSTAVAYGIAHYVAVSNDKEFLYTHGIEMLIEISRFLVSRGSWNHDKTGFGFYAVMGPDEFHMMVNNNVYTNYMTKKTFDSTIEILEDMKKNQSALLSDVMNKTTLTKEELESFSLCSQKMIILFDPKSKIFEQHEGFSTLPHLDINTIPSSEFPLYNHWSYDRIYRTDMIKQPDVLMFMFLYRSEFSQEILKANYEYYEPKTIHESSLSPSVHSVLAAELGKTDEACKFFGFATRLDLDNYNRNTCEGLHTTSIAAAWVNIVFGFGGMRSEPMGQGKLSLSPILPDHWKGYEFRIKFQNIPIAVTVIRDSVQVKFVSKQKNNISVPLYIYENKYVLTETGISVPLLSKSSV